MQRNETQPNYGYEYQKFSFDVFYLGLDNNKLIT
jgi:hypothetical protein